MRELGVIANVQPQFVTTDSRWLDTLLPDELLPWAYAWKSLLDRGTLVNRYWFSYTPVRPLFYIAVVNGDAMHITRWRMLVSCAMLRRIL